MADLIFIVVFVVVIGVPCIRISDWATDYLARLQYRADKERIEKAKDSQ